MLSEKLLNKLYSDLFSAAADKWNWGYEDRYPHYDFIQHSVSNLIRYLLNLSSKTVTAVQIFDEVFNKEIKNLNQDTKEELYRCLLVRFFYRFCIPFGILKAENEDYFLNKKINDPFEKTDFFISDFEKILKS